MSITYLAKDGCEAGLEIENANPKLLFFASFIAPFDSICNNELPTVLAPLLKFIGENNLFTTLFNQKQ